MKGAEKGIGILITQQKSGLVEFNGAVLEVMMGEFTPSLLDELLERDVGIGKAATDR
jgi:hypothetical protein